MTSKRLFQISDFVPALWADVTDHSCDQRKRLLVEEVWFKYLDLDFPRRATHVGVRFKDGGVVIDALQNQVEARAINDRISIEMLNVYGDREPEAIAFFCEQVYQ